MVVTPADALLHEPVALELFGLDPGERVTLRLRNHTLKAESTAVFAADGHGRVNVATQVPLEGDYEDVDAAGLFWSARFDAGCDATTMIGTLATLEPLRYTLSAAAAGGAADTDFTRRLIDPAVRQTPVREGRIRGTLFTPAEASDSPAVVVLGGSDGGNLYTFVAALLAAQGITALSLAFFASDDLPEHMIGIPVEYFAEAVAWLRARPDAGQAGVGMLGFSRGAEAALLTASHDPDVAAVAALAPGTLTGGAIAGADFSAMAKPAWTLNGTPTPLLPPPWDPESMREAQAAFASGTPLAATPGILRSLDSAGARIHDVEIPVERIRGGVLLMSGDDDQLWPSSRFAEIAVRRLLAAGFAHPFEHHRYAAAGHFAALPPNLPAHTSVARHPLVPATLAFGGTARGNAAAAADLWPRIVAFFHECLGAPAAA